MAWHYKYYNNDPELSKLAETARAAKIGLWSQPNPLEPWNFRHKQ
jgi:micrococcal nuclease